MSKARLHIYISSILHAHCKALSKTWESVPTAGEKTPHRPTKKAQRWHAYTHTYANTQLKTDLPQDMLTALAAASLTDCQQCYTQERVCVREKRDGERESYTGWGGKKLEGENEGRKRPKEKARGCLWGQKEEKKNTMETEDGESGKENARNRWRRAVSMKTGLVVMLL